MTSCLTPVVPIVHCWLTLTETAQALERSLPEVMHLIYNGPLPASVIDGELQVHSTHLAAAARQAVAA